MLKGIISLFTSGIIFSPFVLFGIIAGSWCYLNMEPNEIRSLFLAKEFYIVVIVFAVVFVYVFSKRYDNTRRYLDWSAMFWIVVANVGKFFISFILVMSFISMISIF